MTVSLGFYRWSLLISAALLVAVALVVAAVVIPPVRADTFPGGYPQSAAIAFAVNAAFSLYIATVLVRIARRISGRRRLLITILIVVAFVTFLLTFALTDAGFALLAHGPVMHKVAVLLFACSAADLLAAALIVTAVIVFPRELARR